MSKFIDLTGRVFGRLTVIDRADKSDKYGRIFWNCQCSCSGHTRIVVVGGNLRTGNTTSCGCFCLDRVKEVSTKKWVPIERDDYYEIPLSQGYLSKIDKEDLVLISDYKWCYSEGYAAARVRGRSKKNPKIIVMQRLLLCILNDTKMDVDHINHDTLDNRKSNLRVCEHFRNCQNKIQLNNCKSGVTGVHIRPKAITNRYFAMIMYKKKSIYLGGFNSLEEATRARKKAEKLYFGRYAYNATS